MGKYAEGTSVSAAASRAEIEKILTRYGATTFGYMATADRAAITFDIGDRRILLELTLPNPDEAEFWQTPSRGWSRTPAQAKAAYEQAVRQRWRALVLVIKAKLEAVEAGITSLENEFLAHMVLPAGGTVGQWLKPQLDRAYAVSTMPPLLPGSEVKL